MKTTNSTSRRHFLRGAGVALALPWLESFPCMAQGGGGSVAASANRPPIRVAHLYFSHGVEPAHWWAKGEGKGMAFDPGAQPVRPIRGDLLIARGRYTQNAVDYTGPHRGRMNWRCGPPASRDPKEIRGWTSVGQVLAQRIGNQTAEPSLPLGIEPNELRLEDG